MGAHRMPHTPHGLGARALAPRGGRLPPAAMIPSRNWHSSRLCALSKPEILPVRGVVA